MCTVTYLPKTKGEYILTSSRDERTLRSPALHPKEYLLEETALVFPKDTLAGGSWIAYSETRTTCLLNGGFIKHVSTPPYKKSRGLVLLDYFSFPNIKRFKANYDFNNIEPFTLVVIEPEGLFEFRWDGTQSFITQLNKDSPHIWSSVTLYSDEVILKRKNWFTSWLVSNTQHKTESIRLFHNIAGEGDIENDILMNRNDFMRTVSITTIERKTSGITMIYEDLITKSSTNIELLLT
jgi:hypothetical protein